MQIHTAKQSTNKVLLSNFALSIVSWVKNQGSFCLYSQFYVQVLSSQPRAFRIFQAFVHYVFVPPLNAPLLCSIFLTKTLGRPPCSNNAYHREALINSKRFKRVWLRLTRMYKWYDNNVYSHTS